MKPINFVRKFFSGLRKPGVLIAGICLAAAFQSEGAQNGTTTGDIVPCDHPGVAYVFNISKDDQGNEYDKTTVYNGDCTATITYTHNGITNQGPDIWPVYDSCGCAPFSNSIANGLSGHIAVNMATITPNDFTVVALSSNIDHFTIYNLDNGSMVANSGVLAGNTPSFTFSNALLNIGGNYVAAACTSDDLIQGGASFRAGAGAVTQLPQIHDWNNETNLPGAAISALVSNFTFIGIVQLPDKTVIHSTGTLALSYNINLPTGFSLIANQLDHGSNTANVVFSNATGMLDGCSILTWNCKDYDIFYFDSTSLTGFTDSIGNEVPAPVLPPGEGFSFNNETGGALSLTFTGTPHVPVLPAQFACGAGHLSLLGRQTNGLGTYENITGFAPREDVREEIWNGAGYTIYTYTDGSWSPTNPPALPVGTSAFFFEPNSTTPPVIAQQPTSLTVTQGQSATFSVLNTGPGPLSYQWIFCPQPNWNVATNIAGATGSTITLPNVQPADAGSYLVVIGNAFGSVTSAPAVLTVVSTNKLSFDGWYYEAVGSATLIAQSNSIIVGNLGTNGGNGVAFDARLGLNLLWKDVTTTNPWAPGTFFEWQYVNRTGGSNNVVGRLRSQQNGNAIDMLADFSAHGATNYSLQFYNQGALVAERSVSANGSGSTLLWKSIATTGNGGGGGGGNPGNTNSPSGGGSTDMHTHLLQGVPDSSGHYYGYYLPGDGTVIKVAATDPPSGWAGDWITYTEYDEVTYSGSGGFISVLGLGTVDTVGVSYTGGSNLAGSYNTLQLTAANLTNITFTDTSINPFGLTTHALGQAQLGVATNQLPIIGNLGSSGQDGVSVALGRVGGWDGAWLPIDNSQLPVGAYIQTALTGTVSGVSNSVIATMRTIQGSNSVSLLTDFSGLGASTVRCDYYRNGTLVGSTPGQSATLAMFVNNNQITTDAHYSLIGSVDASQEGGTPCTEPGYPCLFAGYTFNIGNPALLTVTGVPTYVDFIKVYPENATATNVGGALNVSIQTARIPSLTLTSMQVHQYAPVLSPLVVLANGNVKVTWSNGILQSTTSLASPIIWTDVPGNHTGSYTTPALGNRLFFRVRQ